MRYTGSKMLARVQAAMAKDDGATAVEYGLMLAFIAVAIVAVLITLGPKIAAEFTYLNANWPALP